MRFRRRKKQPKKEKVSDDDEDEGLARRASGSSLGSAATAPIHLSLDEVNHKTLLQAISYVRALQEEARLILAADYLAKVESVVRDPENARRPQVREAKEMLEAPQVKMFLDELKTRAQECKNTLQDWDSENWILSHVKAGISTFWKRDPDNGTLWVKLQGVMDDVSVIDQLAVVREVDLFELWIPFCRKSYLLKRLGKVELLSYVFVNVPGFSRDAVLHAYACDALLEDNCVLIQGSSRDQVDGVEIPEIKDWGHARMQVYGFKARIEVLSPTAANTSIVANVDPKVPLPPRMLDFLLKSFAGYTLWYLSRAAKKISTQPDNAHRRRIVEDVEFYRDWMLPKFVALYEARGWTMVTPCYVLGEGADEEGAKELRDASQSQRSQSSTDLGSLLFAINSHTHEPSSDTGSFDRPPTPCQSGQRGGDGGYYSGEVGDGGGGSGGGVTGGEGVAGSGASLTHGRPASRGPPPPMPVRNGVRSRLKSALSNLGGRSTSVGGSSQFKSFRRPRVRGRSSMSSTEGVADSSVAELQDPHAVAESPMRRAGGIGQGEGEVRVPTQSAGQPTIDSLGLDPTLVRQYNDWSSARKSERVQGDSVEGQHNGEGHSDRNGYGPRRRSGGEGRRRKGWLEWLWHAGGVWSVLALSLSYMCCSSWMCHWRWLASSWVLVTLGLVARTLLLRQLLLFMGMQAFDSLAGNGKKARKAERRHMRHTRNLFFRRLEKASWLSSVAVPLIGCACAVWVISPTPRKPLGEQLSILIGWSSDEWMRLTALTVHKLECLLVTLATCVLVCAMRMAPGGRPLTEAIN